VWSSLEAGHPLVGAARRHRACEDGQRWTWDGVDFAVLHPAPGDAPAGAKPNARSCVLRVSAPGGSVLLPGDIEREQELGLVDRHGAVLRSTVLLVPHHGSRTSSIAPLLDAVAPQVAVVQAGYRNRFGHPAPDVLARYAARGIPVVASPACGAWTWRSDRPEGVCLRDAARRYWHHGPAP
jgi:competence protein ComEC